MVDPIVIQEAIAPSIREYISNLEVFERIESTNNYLLNKEISTKQARICIAEQQTAGRGRRGNQWHSAANKNIILSISWGFSKWPEGISGLSLAIGMAVATRLNDLFDIGVTLKWPNDLLIGESKLAGILIDLKGDPATPCEVVIGLGLNVWQPHRAAPSDEYQWTDLKSCGIEPNRDRLLALICEDLIQTLIGFEDYGLEPLLSVWEELSSFSGKQILVCQTEQTISGTMLGIDKDGALLVEAIDGQQHRFFDSNVSIRVSE